MRAVERTLIACCSAMFSTHFKAQHGEEEDEEEEEEEE